MRIGIFFGGQSREREISFAGGRTVYDNLDKKLFEPVPIFVDSLGNFILLDWRFIYKGTIRDFYPPIDLLKESPNGFQVYLESLGELTEQEQAELISKVGRRVYPHQFRELFDFAFLALHGPYGEDGSIQGLLEWYDLPYSGAGILPSSIGIDKVAQRILLHGGGFEGPAVQVIRRQEWNEPGAPGKLFAFLKESVGLPMVIKAPHQGSSIGISIVRHDKLAEFKTAVERAFFTKVISQQEWHKMKDPQRVQLIRQLVDIREGIGLPVQYQVAAPEIDWDAQNLEGEQPAVISAVPAQPESALVYHPEELLQKLQQHFAAGKNQPDVTLTNLHTEARVLVEGFIQGKEFSCIVVQDDDGNAIALPPTEIVKGREVFDYRSKYLPGLSRKITPINLPAAKIQEIRRECERLYRAFRFNVYARLDGFVTAKGKVFLNDPNTTSGMLPSSFFFHQAAEIGLNPSQFLTFIIRSSLAERMKSSKMTLTLEQQLSALDQEIHESRTAAQDRIKVGVIMGGYSSERHISVESGRNIFEKLASSTKYEPIPIFLTGSDDHYELYQIPVNIMLKDNADDIKERIRHFNEGGEHHPVLEQIAQETATITAKYATQHIREPKLISFDELPQLVDEVFIALHGRPGEDGALQAELEKVGLAYNGSGIDSSRITINKYETNRILAENGIKVARNRLVKRHEWDENGSALVAHLEQEFPYPFIAKPSDDGCSSAVKKIKNRAELEAFMTLIFRVDDELELEPARTLHLAFKEEFPRKDVFLLEELIGPNGAAHFLEVTGGLLTRRQQDGSIEYEVFEASEALASGEVLSLEEKFLAGEGQNITPARYAVNPQERQRISDQVKQDLQRVAQILRVEGYARIDAFVRIYPDGGVETVVIEVNSLPGMTPATCIFHQTALQGYKPYEFIDQILTYGLSRNTIPGLRNQEVSGGSAY